MERNPQVNWRAVDDIIYGCANQAGEDNRNVARMAGLLAGLPVEVPGTTVNRLCGSGMDAVGLAARSIKSGEAAPDDRRWRRKHVARTVRHGQGGDGLRAQRGDLRHDDRLALRQPGDEEALRHPLDAADRRQRRRRLRHRPRRPGCLRATQPAALGRGRCRRALRRRTGAGGHPAEKGRPEGGRPRRASAPRYDAGDARRPARHQRPRAERHCRQRLRRQRRRLRPAARLGSRRRPLRADSRWRASSAWPPPACRRASWASAPPRRCARYSRRPG